MQQSPETSLAHHEANQSVRRRIRCKAPCPPAYAVATSGLAIVETLPGEHAVAAEAWHDLVPFESDTRRQHVHWVHARAEKPEDKQPESFTRP